METIRIEIVNKRAKRILKDLAALNLINIQDKDPMKAFLRLLNQMRRNKKIPPLSEITREVELVREKKYGKKG